ncbi:hypothetical protein Pcinc_013826 [Petrolisthes cinctipes]|uniref:Uncharacterized protein n=1 Tax=Petrolisthes cinctipes TaxID=88211 RepID=A0AAE1FW31_PETCI|nr:hypothetical protein Pcinc_013826 [Petrolisthes cinctipes]
MMQCAIVFFILSIGFVPAALAMIQSEAQFNSVIQFEPPENHLEISSSKLYEEGGYGNYRFEIMLLEGEAVSMICSQIYLPEPHEQQLAIYDMETQDMMYSTASDNINEDESLLFYNNFNIDLIASSQPYEDQQSSAAEAPHVECSLSRFEPNRKLYAQRPGQIRIKSTSVPPETTTSSDPNGTTSFSSTTEKPRETTIRLLDHKPTQMPYIRKVRQELFETFTVPITQTTNLPPTNNQTTPMQTTPTQTTPMQTTPTQTTPM